MLSITPYAHVNICFLTKVVKGGDGKTNKTSPPVTCENAGGPIGS